MISHAILDYNRDGTRGRADGIVVTPSHNPPGDGGFKYNPPHGGPADTDATGWIQDEANKLLDAELKGVLRVPYSHAQRADTLHKRDYVHAYVADLAQVIDLDAIRESGLRLGVDPLGGASAAYWAAIAEMHGLELEIVNQELDPTFRFVPLDWDGKIRMDCSSPYAMARLTEMRDRFDVAFANDPDADRHGIVTPAAGLLNPNHHLAACIAYLFGGNRDWGQDVGIGKTLVSSSIIDRAASDLGRRVVEVPVGFKWFVEGLIEGTLGFGGEESAGASFLRRDGGAWSTDKDGLIPCLLAAEMKARTGKDPGEIYGELADRHGHAAYKRVDVAASPEDKDKLKKLSPGAGDQRGAGRRADPRQAHQGARQRRADRRAQGGRRARLVRRAAVGHRRRVQGVRRGPRRRGAARAHPRRGPADRRPGPEGITACATSSGSCSREARASGWRRSRSTARSPPCRSAATTG